MLRLLALLYGLVGAVLFAAAALYLPVFLAYHVVPQKWREPIYTQVIASRYIPAIDAEAGGRANDALYMNLGLLAACIIPHSLMAREGFKRVWANIVPQPIERSTYVLISGLTLALLYWFWKPIPEIVWPQEGSWSAWNNTSLRPAFQLAFGVGMILFTSSVLNLAIAESARPGANRFFLGAGRVLPKVLYIACPIIGAMIGGLLGGFYGAGAGGGVGTVIALMLGARVTGSGWLLFGILLLTLSTPVLTLGHLMFSLIISGSAMVNWLSQPGSPTSVDIDVLEGPSGRIVDN